MDVLFFLKNRTAFTRQFYERAAAPFIERKLKIEAGEDPFQEPYYDEHSNGEPAFLDEWMEADESLQVLAYSCVCMLAAALDLFFTTWLSILGITIGDAFKAEFKRGKLTGYKAYFSEHFSLDFNSCPAKLGLLEEVVLARNSVQHPKNISLLLTRYEQSAMDKLSRPLFVAEIDKAMNDLEGGAWLSRPTLHVTAAKLVAASEEIDKFCEWLDMHLTRVRYKR